MTGQIDRSGKTRPEIYVLLAMGFKPKQLIERGYSKSTVYACHRRMPAVYRRVQEFAGFRS